MSYMDARKSEIDKMHSYLIERQSAIFGSAESLNTREVEIYSLHTQICGLKRELEFLSEKSFSISELA